MSQIYPFGSNAIIIFSYLLVWIVEMDAIGLLVNIVVDLAIVGEVRVDVPSSTSVGKCIDVGFKIFEW